MWSQRDPAARRSGVGNIVIKNLDPTITVKEINDTFANFGEISSCKVQTDDNGVSKGFAFVNFNREDDAEKAIQAINGKIIRDKIVFVAKFVPRTQRNTHNKDFTNCYINNFGTHFTDKTLREMFESCGEIVSAKVMVDKEGNSKGFGFVSFKEHEDALKAVNTYHGKMIEEKPIYVGRAMKKAERQRELRVKYEKTRQERLQQHKSGVNLYIKNLGNDINDDRLRAEFDGFGKITSAKVMLNKENNTSKGFGFVCFSAPEEATRAITEMNGKIVDGKPLYVALAQKKEDRVTHLRSQIQQRVRQPQHAVFNQGMMNSMMNPNAQRPFMARHGNIIPGNRWPPNVPYMTTPRNNIVGMPANQNLMMTGLAQQSQRRNILVDPMMNQNRNARPITGNVQMNQARPQYNMVANGRPAMYQYPMQDNQQMMNPDQIKLPDIESQIDLSTTSKIANADSMEAKQLLGEKIYPLVSKIAGDMAGKITGMFLELDNAELLYMIENENSLRMKVTFSFIIYLF